MKDFRSLEHKIRDIVSETVGRNTEQRMKIKNVGRPGDDPKDADKSKLAKQGEIKTKIIDEASFKRGDKVSYETSKNNKNNKGVVHSVKGDKVTVKGSNYLGGEVLHDVHHSMVRKEETEIDEATKKKVKEDDQTTDPIARINAVTSNLKQMTNEPKPAPSLPNVNDIPSSNPASKMFKIKEAASDSFDKSDDKKKESKEPKKDSKKDDGDDPKKITGGKTEVDLQPTTNDSPEMNDTEDKSSKKATNKANKEIGAKGVKEQVMSQKNFGLPESLIQAVNEVLKGKQKNLDKNHNGKIDAQDFKILKGKKKVEEETEELDELSKGTLGSYIKKSTADATDAARRGGVADAKKAPSFAKSAYKTVEKRQAGIAKATDKLTKEEVEQVDEVSKDTLQHYIRLASTDAANHAYTAGKGAHGKMTINKDAYHALADKRLKGISKAAQKLAKEEVEDIHEIGDTPRGQKALKSYTKKANKQVDKAEDIILNPSNRIYRGAERGNSNAENKYAKADITYHKRLSGIDAAKKRMKEEVESIEELSKGAMKSYVKQVDKKGESDKRSEGLAVASKKIAKQETNRTLQRAVNKIGNTPISKTKASDAHKYDASRQELKGRGIHNFAGRRTRYEEVEFSAEELARIEAIAKNFDEGIIKKKSDVNEADMPRMPRVPTSEFPVRMPRVPDWSSDISAPVNTGSSPAPNVPNASDKPKISAPAPKNETIAKRLK